LIESSLSSSFTRINFFIHNLAQMRFHGGESDAEKRILSFSPQIHPYKEDEGIIALASVVGFQKRYSPEKYYVSYLFCYNNDIIEPFTGWPPKNRPITCYFYKNETKLF